jgi:aspartate carbamoyltransferase regulatory subunit
MPKRTVFNLITNDPLESKTTDSIEDKVITFVCDNTDCILDPLDQIKYSLNEVQLTYGSVVVLKDAP